MGGDMESIVLGLDKMTDEINLAVAISKKSPKKYTIAEFLARQQVITDANAANRHSKRVSAGHRAVSTLLRVNMRTRGLKYILTKPPKRKKRKKIISDDQYSLFQGNSKW